MDGRALSSLRSRSRAAAALATFTLGLFITILTPPPCDCAQKEPDVPRLLREIRNEVVGLGRYPGEEFSRGEFFLGEGDDDTNKTHAVGILVKDEADGSRMTIVCSRLEPSPGDPRVKNARDPRTIVCAFKATGIDLVRSDYSPSERGKLLPAVLKAVVDKRNLLKR
jgi:hypothetical protein